MLALTIAFVFTVGSITGYLLGLAVGEARAQARRLNLPRYLTSDERWRA